MIGKEEIEKTIKDMKALKHDVTVTDLSFCLLNLNISNPFISYTVLFGKGKTKEEFDEYYTSSKIKTLTTYVDANFTDKAESEESESKFKDITFEQNKEELIKRLKELDVMVRKGEIERKEAIKFEIDIRTKLNDKFGTSEKNEEQRVIVLPKYNHICEWTGRECWLQTKQAAMDKYGLVDMEELQKKYKLVKL